MSATTELLDLVRSRLNIRFDVELARQLEVSRPQIYRWRRADDHMSADTVARACKLIGEDKRAFYWVTRVAAERETGEQQRQALEVLEDMRRMEKGQQPRKGGIVDLLIHWGQGKAAAILAAVALTLLGALTPEKPAFAATPTHVGITHSLYIMTNMRCI